MEGNAGNVVGVTFEGKNCGRVGGFYVVEFYGVVASGGEVAFVGTDAEAVDLAVWMWDCSAADAGEGFPESLSDINCLFLMVLKSD